MVNAGVRNVGYLSSQMVSARKDVSVKSTTDDFAKMMDESINKTKDTAVKSETQTETKIQEKSEIKETEVDKKYDEKVEDNVEEKTEVDDVENKDLTEDETISEEILSAVATILNVSVEELQATLEELGMESKDLLDINNVTELVMNLKGIDTKLELLVHEDANDVIKEVQKGLETLMDSVKDIMSNKQPVEDKTVVEENVSDELTDVLNNTQVENTANEEETQFSEDGKQETSSKEEKTKSSNETPLNELREDVLNKIEVALEDRVDETTSTRIIREITDNISVAIKEKMTSLEMQLYPEHLGKVTVMLATEEGGIRAKITAETEMAKNAIEQQLTILKDNFEKQGLNVSEIEVTIASHGFEENLDKNDSKNEEQQKKNSGIGKSLLDEINGTTTTDEEEAAVIERKARGNTISYLA